MTTPTNQHTPTLTVDDSLARALVLALQDTAEAPVALVLDTDQGPVRLEFEQGIGDAVPGLYSLMGTSLFDSKEG